MSASFNRVILVGNLTRDIEVRYTPKGTAVTDIGLAVNRKTKQDDGTLHEETTFVDCTVWDKLAENCAKFLSKGSPVLIEGRLHLDQWTDKESQNPRSRLKVIAENVQFLDRKPSEGEASREPTREAPRQEEDIDDIPF